jgi:hypothetical protein
MYFLITSCADWPIKSVKKMPPAMQNFAGSANALALVSLIDSAEAGLKTTENMAAPSGLTVGLP